MSVCTQIVSLLKKRGASTAFGMPGIHNLPVYAALHDAGIETITVRHEQSASFAADGYARALGKPAICAVIDGPGFLNASTGIAQARGDSVPMVVLTPVGEPPTRGALHELSGQSTISQQICKASIQISRTTSTRDLELFLDRNLCKGRPGPLHIEIPLSLMEAHPLQNSGHSSQQHVTTTPLSELDTAAKLLQNSTSPIVIAGGGVIDSREELQAFAEAIDAPVVNTVNAKGILPRNHPLRVGYSPSLPEVRLAIEKSDVVVALGTELSETDFDFLLVDKPWDFQCLIRIDVDPNQVSINAVPDCTIVGDCKEVLSNLDAQSAPKRGAQRTAQIRESASKSWLVNQQMCEFLDAIRDSTDVLMGDSTQPVYFATWLYEPNNVREYFASTTGFGTLGYAIPATIGAKVACPEKRVACLVGDGGAHFTLAEIQTAAQLGIGIPFMIWNNRGYSEIDKAMEMQTDTSWYQSPTPPDYRSIAEAFGANYRQPVDLPSLTIDIRDAHDDTKPSIINVEEEKFAGSISEINWFSADRA